MRALFYNETTGPGAIRRGDLPVPDIAGNEVLVRVKAFSLNHLDVWVMSGKYPMRPPMPHVFASDAAGLVEQVGAGVANLAPGDEVIIHPGLSCGKCERCTSGHDDECRDFQVLGAMTPGVSAEYVKVPAVNVFRKPDGLSFEEAACIGITYATAWNALVLRARIRENETALILGGGGGAGTALIQAAKQSGAQVIATVGDDWKVEKARAIGADHVMNHAKEDFLEAVKRITDNRLADVAVDHVGAATFNKTLAAVRRGGRVVTFGATTGDEVPLSLRRVFGRSLSVHGVYTGPRSAVPEYLPLFPGKLRPVVDSVFAFGEAQKAYEKLLSRQFFGKIVVRVG